MLDQSDTISTTVEVPVELFERSQRFIEMGFFSNANALILAALEQFVSELEEQESEFEYEDMDDFDDEDWDNEDFEDYNDD